VNPIMRSAAGAFCVLALAGILAVPPASGQAGEHSGKPDHYDHAFRDAEAWSKTFDDPARDRWQQPERVIAALQIAPDADVADIGSGTGYFSVRLGKALPRGRVIGIDIQPDMVRFLNERAARERLPNVMSRLGTAEDPGIAAESVDLVLMVDTYHHIGARERYFEKVRAGLRPGGRLAIVDFRPETALGPPRHFRVTESQVKAEMAKAGFGFVETVDILADQFILVFRRP